MFGVAAMAVQNAVVQISLTNTPTTAVMTTNVTHFMLDLGEALVGRDHGKSARAHTRAMHTLPVIVGFPSGACSARVVKLLLACGPWLCPRRLPCSLSQWVLETGVTARKTLVPCYERSFTELDPALLAWRGTGNKLHRNSVSGASPAIRE
jgi:Protein of unknown function (DUF1275)